MNDGYASGGGSGEGSFVIDERFFSISAAGMHVSNNDAVSGATGLQTVSCVTRLPIYCFLFVFLFSSYLGPFSHRLKGKSTPGRRESHTTLREKHTVLRESHTIQEVTYEA